MSLPAREPDPPSARREFGDVRDDYDDAPRGARTPREEALRRVRGPATGVIVSGAVGILGMMAIAIAVIDNFLAPWRHIDIATAIVYGWLILLGVVLFAGVIVGGLAMRRLRRRTFSLFAAYVVAGLSIGGYVTAPLYPFGVWALIVLYRSDVRREFDRPPVQSQDDH